MRNVTNNFTSGFFCNKVLRSCFKKASKLIELSEYVRNATTCSHSLDVKMSIKVLGAKYLPFDKLKKNFLDFEEVICVFFLIFWLQGLNSYPLDTIKKIIFLYFYK